MNFKRKLQILFLSLFFILPINVLAYSNKVIIGGQNIGIKVNSKYVTIVGFYEVEGKNIAKNAGLQIGDQILEINEKKISNIDDVVKNIDNSNIKITVLRNNKEKTIEFTAIKDENGIIKTGIYVKDKITGIGTLTYIDPNTKIFGALGHEILDSVTGKKVEIKDGEIFNSNITGITRSSEGTPGEKNATFDINDIYGKININETTGIFGNYIKEMPTDKLISVGKKDEIKTGQAKILTVIKGNNIEEFSINITNINKDSKIKNILFEVTDKNLIEKSNGIVSGMSGSPIIQNGKIVAAVTHVVVSDPLKGYGIFIENMLEEGDKSRE